MKNLIFEGIIASASCQQGKHVEQSFMEHNNKERIFPLDLIHSDVWGPAPVKSLSGYSYYVTFIDDYSRCTRYATAQI